MISCDECGNEFPDDPRVWADWMGKQRHQLEYDEMVYGSSFQCGNCGIRMDPRDMTVSEDQPENMQERAKRQLSSVAIPGSFVRTWSGKRSDEENNNE